MCLLKRIVKFQTWCSDFSIQHMVYRVIFQTRSLTPQWLFLSKFPVSFYRPEVSSAVVRWLIFGWPNSDLFRFQVCQYGTVSTMRSWYSSALVLPPTFLSVNVQRHCVMASFRPMTLYGSNSVFYVQEIKKCGYIVTEDELELRFYFTVSELERYELCNVFTRKLTLTTVQVIFVGIRPDSGLTYT